MDIKMAKKLFTGDAHNEFSKKIFMFSDTMFG